MIILHLDTTISKELYVALEIDKKLFEKRKNSDFHNAQQILPLLEELLKENQIEISSIQAITVACGPGSFTGLRVGIAVANTLGATLHIPINGNPPDVTVEPIYE